MEARLKAFVIGAGIALTAACSGGTATSGSAAPPAPPPPPPPTQPPPPAPPPDVGVEPPLGSAANFDIIDDSFVDESGNHDQQAEATVKVGEMVTWTQNGKHIHRVEFSELPSAAGAPDSGDLRPNNTWEFRPPAPGKYVFFCRYHEYMMDVVINVVAADGG